MLFVLVMGMLTLSVTQIFLRNFFEFGIVWAEALTRMIVLWTAMIGSMIAARSSKHISIDLIDRYLKGKSRPYILGTGALISSTLCASMMYFSARFLAMEHAEPSAAFADIPNWIFISIISVSLLIMSLRYLLRAYALITGKDG